MPNYDYECEACGKVFEVSQSILEKPLEICILCKKGRAKRIIKIAPGIVFKGSGWTTKRT